MNNNKEEEINNHKNPEEIDDEKINNNIINNMNNLNPEMGVDGVDNSDNIDNIYNINNNELNLSSSDDFLEKSLINEIKQTMKQLEQNCENQIGESAIENRCRILSYAIVLVDVYKKPISNLIYPHAKLGEAYYDIKYYEQAKEHLENAIKYNNEQANQTYQALPEDYLIRLTIKLSRCYLEIQQYELALKLSNKVLEQNNKLFGEKDISNVEIYDIIYQAEKNMQKYSIAAEHLKILKQFYSQIYDEKSDKCLNVLEEIAHLYELDGQIKEAIMNYLKYLELLEEIDRKDKIKLIFETAQKIGGLYAEIKEYKEAYDFLKKIEKDYNNGYNRTDKEKYIYQRLICTLASFLKDDDNYLEELLIMEKILTEASKVKKALLGKTYLDIGHVFKTKNNFDKSIEYFKKAFNIYKNESDGKLLNDINQIIKFLEKEKRNQEISKI